MLTMQVDVAFITVNYNTCALVEELIRFFKAVELPFSYRLVVVDNNSTDGSQAMLAQERWDGLLYIQTNENLGYGRGMNCGLQAVASRYACIMNTDLILNRDALVALWSFLNSTPSAGVASPVILGSNQRIQSFVFHPGVVLLYFPWLGKMLSKLRKLQVKYSLKPVNVPGVMGAFFMIRRACCSRGFLFDEDFFFYFEDAELANRLFSQKVLSYVLPQVAIIHTGGQSTSENGGRLFYESKQIYINKCYGANHLKAIGKLDNIRILLKYFKYLFLVRIMRIEKVSGKFLYYSRLVRK
jgi:GT2 family glycosyltransferase